MTAQGPTGIDRYLERVRRGLRGLPQPDVDDTIEEMRTHLVEEAAERGDAEKVLADFGDAGEVASRIVRERLCPEDGPAVPEATVGRRYSAWATDVVVGFGPLLLVPTIISMVAPFSAAYNAIEGTAPIWVLLVAWVLEHWVMTPAELGQVPTVSIPIWQWFLLAGLLAWAGYYWLVLRRRDSRSVGMWMTGLRVVRVDDDRMVVRARDISLKPVPIGAGRNRWWILLAAIPTGCLCILLALYYLTFTVGSVVQPWDALSGSFEARADDTRQRELCGSFAQAIVQGQRDSAIELCRSDAAPVVDELLDLVAADDFESLDYAASYEPGSHELLLRTDTTSRVVSVLVDTTERVDGGDYITSYRISQIVIGPPLERRK